jgi:hypothetical protein
MGSITQKSSWNTDFDRAFDESEATDLAASAVSPFVVAADFIANGAAFEPEMYTWLIRQGVDRRDIGRFARLNAVTAPALLQVVREAEPGGVSKALKGFVGQPPPAVASGERVPDFDDRIRAQIEVAAEVRKNAADAWDAIRQANEPKQLFRFGAQIAWTHANQEDDVSIHPMTLDDLRWVHHRVIAWGVTAQNGSWSEKPPPDPVLRDMVAEPHKPLPPLDCVASVPVFGGGGTLRLHSGYHAASKTFVWLGRLIVPFVPMRPTARDITVARQLLEVELLGDFPFEDDASRAHAIAMIVQPFCRPMIRGFTPLYVIDKPTPGTGAGLLTDIHAAIVSGHEPARITLGTLNDNNAMKLYGALSRGPQILILDNLASRLDSRDLATALTCQEYGDRTIGTSKVTPVPVRNVWIATGNSVTMSSEIARRSVLIRMDANLEHPEDRKVFRHDDLLGWTREHRGRLVWAALTLIAAWVAEGRPPGSEPKGSYESWAKTIGGILAVAGIPGFLTNTHKLREAGDAEARTWERFAEGWWDKFGERPVTAADLREFADELLADVHASKNTDRAVETIWGTMVARKKDATIGGRKIVESGTSHGAKRWKLVPQNLGGGSTRTSPPPVDH